MSRVAVVAAQIISVLTLGLLTMGAVVLTLGAATFGTRGEWAASGWSAVCAACMWGYVALWLHWRRTGRVPG